VHYNSKFCAHGVGPVLLTMEAINWVEEISLDEFAPD
jgi:hypothetical protein